MAKADLVKFEEKLKLLWEHGKIRTPHHFCGGNEDKLIEIFQEVKPEDWVFSTWRNAYHWLLKTGDYDYLYNQIVNKSNSMHINDISRKFISSAIVGGTCGIAVGTAYAIKLAGKVSRVYCFCGDGCLDEGFFWEALRYAQAQDLNIIFVIENNNRSVCTSINARWGEKDNWSERLKDEPKVYYYEYEAVYPHVGSGQFITFM